MLAVLITPGTKISPLEATPWFAGKQQASVQCQASRPGVLTRKVNFTPAGYLDYMSDCLQSLSPPT